MNKQVTLLQQMKHELMKPVNNVDVLRQQTKLIQQMNTELQQLTQ